MQLKEKDNKLCIGFSYLGLNSIDDKLVKNSKFEIKERNGEIVALTKENGTESYITLHSGKYFYLPL